MKITTLIVILTALLSILGCDGNKSSSSRDFERDDDAYQLDIDLSGSLQNPAFSPDGTSIVFTRFRNGYNEEPADLYIYDLQSEELKQLVSDGSGNVNLPGSTWNDDISSLVFSSSRDPHDEIFLIAEDGANGSETQITDRVGPAEKVLSVNLQRRYRSL